MSWFEYGTPERRAHRKGVWLRVRSLPDEIRAFGEKNKRFGETIQWVVVQEIRPRGRVLLEFWCQGVFGPLKETPRYTVFHMLVNENPAWVCEGDLGRAPYPRTTTGRADRGKIAMALKHKDGRVFNLNGQRWIEWDLQDDEFSATGQMQFSFTASTWTLLLGSDMDEIHVKPDSYDPNGNTEALFQHGITLFHTSVKETLEETRKERDRLETIRHMLSGVLTKEAPPARSAFDDILDNV